MALDIPEMDVQAELKEARENCGMDIGMVGGEKPGNKLFEKFLKQRLGKHDELR